MCELLQLIADGLSGITYKRSTILCHASQTVGAFHQLLAHRLCLFNCRLRRLRQLHRVGLETRGNLRQQLLSEVTSGLQTHTVQLTQASETAVEQTQAMSEQLMEGANRLTGMTENSTALIGDSAQSVRDQLKQLAHSSDQALAKLGERLI